MISKTQLRPEKILALIEREPAMTLSEIVFRLGGGHRITERLKEKEIITTINSLYYSSRFIDRITQLLKDKDGLTTCELCSCYREQFNGISLENLQNALIALKIAKIIKLEHGTPDKWRTSTEVRLKELPRNKAFSDAINVLYKEVGNSIDIDIKTSLLEQRKELKRRFQIYWTADEVRSWEQCFEECKTNPANLRLENISWIESRCR